MATVRARIKPLDQIPEHFLCCAAIESALRLEYDSGAIFEVNLPAIPTNSRCSFCGVDNPTVGFAGMRFGQCAVFPADAIDLDEGGIHA